MTKFAHLGDLHIGSRALNPKAPDGRNQRLVDFEQSALLAVEYALEQEIDFAIIAGDLLDDTNLMPASLSGAVHLVKMFTEAQVPLIVIGGNHDVAEAEGRYNALKFLAEHYPIELHLDQGYRDIAGIRLHLAPYRVISRAQRGRGQLEPFDFSTDTPNLLVAHGYAPGEGVPDIPEGTETVIPAEWLSDPRFDLCLLGHIHHHGEISDRVFYSGSTERRNFGEAAERPGFFIHQIERSGKSETISIPIDTIPKAQEANLPRPMVSHELNALEMTVPEVEAAVNELIDRASPGSMLRVVLDNVSESLGAEERKKWAQRHLDNGGFHFESTVRTQQVTELLSVAFKERPKDIAQGLAEYIEGQEETEDREEVLALAAELSAEARELVLAQDGGE